MNRSFHRSETLSVEPTSPFSMSELKDALSSEDRVSSRLSQFAELAIRQQEIDSIVYANMQYYDPVILTNQLQGRRDRYVEPVALYANSA